MGKLSGAESSAEGHSPAVESVKVALLYGRSR